MRFARTGDALRSLPCTIAPPHLRTVTLRVCVLAFALAGARGAWAQGPSLDRGVEIAVVYGANRGMGSLAAPFAQGLVIGGLRDVRIDAEPTSQPLIGVNGAGHVTRHILVFSEGLYNNLGESRLSGRVGFGPRTSLSLRPWLFEWTSGVRIQVPAGGRVRPYVGVGAGIVILRIVADGGAGVSVDADETDFTYHVAFGARFFFTEWFGVAPEYRLVRYPGERFSRITIGAVFRLD